MMERNRKRLVLVVEDEMINREMLCACLEDDYEILCAVTGKEALAAVAAHTDLLSVVLLDLILPDIHGLEILRQLKEGEETSRIPVIVMTSDKESEVESLNMGASDFISKPYPMPEVVRARVRRTIELSENRDLIRWTERDQLTHLYNREYFFHYAELYDMYHKDEAMDALVVDVNHFHMVNERYGKHYADGILRRIGQELAEWEGIACRRGADTFLAYLPHTEDYSGLLEKLTAAACGDARGRIRLRMGAYANADKSIGMDRRFDRAKMAADSIRESYTTSIGMYDYALHEKEIYAERLLEEFQEALEQKQFLVYFQPKYDIRPEKPVLCGAEALVRWKHPELGMISPGVFVPLFENNGLVLELDSYVWREAAAQIREWKDSLGKAVPVSVNVSRIDMRDPDLTTNLFELVREYRLDHSDFHLEITESAYTQDAQQIIDTVHSLRDAGFVIEMDDFGSGYSSLNMISTLPIDMLKLDMGFIRNAFSATGNTKMLKVIINIAESLGVPMIAEGVETEEQMLALKEMGCDIVQGYYFSRPVPPDEFETFLKA